jgi:superfamily II DNA/RNA helicase
LLETGVLQPSAMKMLVLDEADLLMTESFAEDVRYATPRSSRRLAKPRP